MLEALAAPIAKVHDDEPFRGLWRAALGMRREAGEMLEVLNAEKLGAPIGKVHYEEQLEVPGCSAPEAPQTLEVPRPALPGAPADEVLAEDPLGVIERAAVVARSEAETMLEVPSSQGLGRRSRRFTMRSCWKTPRARSQGRQTTRSTRRAAVWRARCATAGPTWRTRTRRCYKQHRARTESGRPLQRRDDGGGRHLPAQQYGSSLYSLVV